MLQLPILRGMGYELLELLLTVVVAPSWIDGGIGCNWMPVGVSGW
jgi:hypothetical protein